MQENDLEQTPSRKRWETPVSDAKSLALVSLTDHNGLHIKLQDLGDPLRRRFRIVFEQVLAYRNILEEYRLFDADAWSIHDPAPGESAEPTRLGWTVIDDSSAWLESLTQREPMLEDIAPMCVHYVVATEDDVIDILTSADPSITELEPAAADEPTPGKSRILYSPEDREQIDELIDDMKGRPSPRS